MKKIINVTPHDLTFQSTEHSNFPSQAECIFCNIQNDELNYTDCIPHTYTIKPCGILINAKPTETPSGKHNSGVELVKTIFQASKEDEEKLSKLEQENPDAIIVGSIIAAQAFPGRVLAMIPAPGFERVPPDQKRMRDDKFTTF